MSSYLVENVDEDIRLDALQGSIDTLKDPALRAYNTIYRGLDYLTFQQDMSEKLAPVIKRIIDEELYNVVPTEQPYGSPEKMIHKEFGLSMEESIQLVMKHKPEEKTAQQLAAERRQAIADYYEGDIPERTPRGDGIALAKRFGVTRQTIGNDFAALKKDKEVSGSDRNLDQSIRDEARGKGMAKSTLYDRRKRLSYLQEHHPELYTMAVNNPEQLNELYRSVTSEKPALDVVGQAAAAIMKLEQLDNLTDAQWQEVCNKVGRFLGLANTAPESVDDDDHIDAHCRRDAAKKIALVEQPKKDYEFDDDPFAETSPPVAEVMGWSNA